MKEKKTKIGLLTIALGCWQAAFAMIFSNALCFCSPIAVIDLCIGLLLIVFGSLSLSQVRVWPGWFVGLFGLVLQCTPLLLWGSSLIYLNDTLIGAIAIIFCFQLTNGDLEESAKGCPRGWSYNPSSWSHRIPTAFLAMLCWFFARYMAAYQLGYITHIWDPFFPHGTLRVITSNVSQAFPISDAGLGAFFYSIEAILAWQGGQRRWASMPWLVFSFAFLVIPVGVVSIILIILQPLVVGTWCTWCLATAFCMLLMIILTAGEFVATVQFLNESVQRKESFWRVFFKGGVEVKGDPVKPLMKRKVAWGISIPWHLLVCVFLGLALILLPAYLYFQDKLAASDYIVGPIAFALAVISMAEVFRIIRYGLVPIGAWTLLSPWIMPSLAPNKGIVACHLVIGILLIILSLPKGSIKERYGSWDRQNNASN